MLPFATIDFYLLFTVLVALVYGLKGLMQGRFSLGSVLLVISLLYAVAYFPKPWQLLLFTAYQLLFTWLLLFRWKKLHGLIGVLLLALPMILVKLDWSVDVIGFAGISYITFRCIQVYLDGALLRDRFHIGTFTVYLLFPPALLAGPIDRYERFKDDLDQGWSRLNGNALLAGWEFIALGLLHKFVLAELIDRYWLSECHGCAGALPMLKEIYGYTVYLYFDFAGYSLLAIGLGRMLGIELPKNFDRPWLTENPPQFWKRWHISLGDWLRDYFFRPIYKALSGVQGLRTWPLLKQNLALFATFLLMGCWNGLEPHYIISGSLFGLYSVLYNSYQHQSRKHKWHLWGGTPTWLVKGISIFVMLHAASFALYIFSGRFPALF